MTRQEKIREGMAIRLHELSHRGKTTLMGWLKWDELPDESKDLWRNKAGELLSYLHSQRCRIKVKCPDCKWSQFVGEESVGMTPCHSCNSTGYLIEPLIEEGK